MAKKDLKLKENEKVIKSEEINIDGLITVKTSFRDKYDEKIVYTVGDKFIEDKNLKDNKPVKEKEGTFKVSTARYEELKKCLYVN